MYLSIYLTKAAYSTLSGYTSTESWNHHLPPRLGSWPSPPSGTRFMSQHGVCLYRSAEDGLTLCPEPLVVWPGSLESAAGTIRALRGFSSVLYRDFRDICKYNFGTGRIKAEVFQIKINWTKMVQGTVSKI